MHLFWGFNKIKILKLFEHFFFQQNYFYKYQNSLMFKFWKFKLYELLETLNWVPSLKTT